MDRDDLEFEIFGSLMRKASAMEKAFVPLPLTVAIADFVELVINCYKSGGKLIVFGNGGSSSDAAHFCSEFTGRFKKDRKPYPAICLNDSSFLTAVGNDYGFEAVFSRGVAAFAKENDLVIGISTSGKSPNFCAGLGAALNQGVTCVALVGVCGVVSPYPTLVVETNTVRTDITQEIHMSILHTVVEMVEREL